MTQPPLEWLEPAAVVLLVTVFVFLLLLGVWALAAVFEAWLFCKLRKFVACVFQTGRR